MNGSEGRGQQFEELGTKVGITTEEVGEKLSKYEAFQSYKKA